MPIDLVWAGKLADDHVDMHRRTAAPPLGRFQVAAATRARRHREARLTR
jgi:hypothetical protein